MPPFGVSGQLLTNLLKKFGPGAETQVLTTAVADVQDVVDVI